MPLTTRRIANAAPARLARQAAKPRHTEELIGTLVELDLDRQRVRLQEERSGQVIRIDLSRAQLRNLVDTDGDGRSTLRDLFPGDRVRVLTDFPGSDARRGSGTGRRLWRIGPPAPPGGLRRLAW